MTVSVVTLFRCRKDDLSTYQSCQKMLKVWTKLKYVYKY
uniref:Uncharacterized protein n=1 Tax=Anguilla anguilla TaxID=7936 RepID=A0A0E9Q924_ANGAN